MKKVIAIRQMNLLQLFIRLRLNLLVSICIAIMLVSCTVAYVPTHSEPVPEWAPTYTNTNTVQYYYFPDIECYYDVVNHDYIYREYNNWMFANTLPASYDWYDINNACTVVIDARVHEPWKHNDFYVQHYPKYYYKTYYRNQADGNGKPLRGFNENDKKEVYSASANQFYNHGNENNPRVVPQQNNQYQNGVHHEGQKQNNNQYNSGQSNGEQHYNNQVNQQQNPPHNNNQPAQEQNVPHQNPQQGSGQNQGNAPHQQNTPVAGQNQSGQVNPPHQNGQPNGGQNQGNQTNPAPPNPPHQNGQPNAGQNQEGNQTNPAPANPPHQNGQSNGGQNQGNQTSPAPAIPPHQNGQPNGGQTNPVQVQTPLPATETPRPLNGGHFQGQQVIQTRPPQPVQYNNNLIGKPVKVNKAMLRPQPQTTPQQ